MYAIESPAFSREYSVLDSSGTCVAVFDRINGWLQPGAFRLRNSSPLLDSYELIAVVMGVHNIQKQHNNAAANAST